MPFDASVQCRETLGGVINEYYQLRKLRYTVGDAATLILCSSVIT